MSSKETRLALIGAGAIGGAVIAALGARPLPGVTLVGTIDIDRVIGPDGQPTSAAEVLDQADLVVEAAGVEGLRSWGPRAVAAGCDLLVMSVGGLADPELAGALGRGPGRTLVTSGAIGGLDLLGAVSRAGTLSRVELVTIKPASSLGVTTGVATEVFRGGAGQAVAAHPRSLNVAAALALACGSWDLVEVSLVADPDAVDIVHTVEFEGDVGSYRIEVRNRPSATTPTTSGITVGAVLRAIEARSAPWRFA